MIYQDKAQEILDFWFKPMKKDIKMRLLIN